MTDLLAHVERTIRERKLLSCGKRILVAVSGGLDSTVLLQLLHRLAAENHWRLVVAHFNHQLRGRSSDADEQFVRQSAARLGLQSVVGRGAVNARARQTGRSLEMAARDLRHAFLARTARRLKCDMVALAHHADDQVELFFLRLFRGSGGEGLAGMKWRAASPVDSRVQLIRPLLDVRRADLASFARENMIRFREDASNASLDLRRNRIRHELLPLLETRYQPGLAKSVLRLMEIVGAETEVVTESAAGWLASKHRQAFDNLPRAVQRRCVQLQLQRLEVAADFSTIEWLREAPDRPLGVGPGVSVYRDKAGLVHTRTRRPVAFQPGELSVCLKQTPGEAVFSGIRCGWRFCAGRSLIRHPNLKQREFFDADKVGSNITLRHWRSGDRFQPIGMSAPVKLQDWFTNQKIPAARRRELLVAATASGEIFWVEGLRISERFKLTKGTRRQLIWLWKKA